MSNKPIHIKDKRKNEDKQAQDCRGQLSVVRAVRNQELGGGSQTWNTSTLLAFIKIQRVSFQHSNEVDTNIPESGDDKSRHRQVDQKKTHMKTNKLKTGLLPTLNSEITRNTDHQKQTHKEKHKSPHTWRQTNIITNKHSYIEGAGVRWQESGKEISLQTQTQHRLTRHKCCPVAMIGSWLYTILSYFLYPQIITHFMTVNYLLLFFTLFLCSDYHNMNLS